MTTPVLRVNAPAYFETVRDGLIPCRVLSITDTRDHGFTVTLRVHKSAAQERSGYRPGEVIETHHRHAIPPAAVHRRRYGTFVSAYTVEPTL